MKLMEPLQGKGHCHFIDKFYTSPSLLLDLLDLGTYCTVTVRTNFPHDLKPDETCAIGSFRFAMCKQETLIAVWWWDWRDVYIMSTMHNFPQPLYWKDQKVNVRKSESRPTAIVDYNKYGGVDLVDQFLSYYSMTTRCTLKWWKRYFGGWLI